MPCGASTSTQRDFNADKSINRVKRKLIDCAHFVPEDVASGDLSDSADFRIYKLRISNTGLGSVGIAAVAQVLDQESAGSRYR
jgi:hypothetical protein